MPSWIKLRVPAFGQPANTIVRVDSPGQVAQLLNGGFADLAADPGGSPPAVPSGSPGGDFTTDAELAAALAGLGGGGGGVTDAAMAAAYGPSTGARVAADPLLRAAYVAVFTPQQFGAKADGATDDTAAVQAAINAAGVAGGTVHFPAGHYVLAGALTTFPTDATVVSDNGGVLGQHPIALRGAAGQWRGDAAHKAPLTGAVLDFRGDPTVAHIDTRGCGHLVIEDLTLTTTVTTGKPFVATTGTALHIERVRFLGPAAQVGPACVTDAVWLGGSTTQFGMGADSAFQGYGTTITHCQFDRIQRAAYGRAYANSIVVRDSFWTADCGGFAALEIASLNGAVSTGWLVSGNVIEITNYEYGVVFTDSPANTFIGNSWWDYLTTGTATAAVYLRGANGGSMNNVFLDFFQGMPVEKMFLDATGGTNQYFALANLAWLGRSIFTAGGNGVVIQPALATGSETARLLIVTRSGEEATDPNVNVTWLEQKGTLWLQGGDAGLNAVSGGAQLNYHADGIIQPNGADLPLYAGTSTGNTVAVRRGAFLTNRFATANRPPASAFPEGSHIWDLTLHRPVWSRGTDWIDAMGNVV